MKRLAILGAISLLTLSVALTAHAAGIYKWTDDKGVTHYTQTPPPDPSRARNIRDEITVTRGVQAPQVNQADEEKTEIERAREAGERNLQRAHANCRDQRTALKELIKNPVVRFKMDDSAPRILSAAEREQKIQEFQKSIDEFCNERILPTKVGAN